MVSRRVIVVSALLSWLLAISAGFALLNGYASTPGVSGLAPQAWPSDSRVLRDPKRFTLVTFLHPRCPCSRATVAELDALMARAGGRVTARAVFTFPRATGVEWLESDLRKRASRIPGVSTFHDIDGEEAARFGAATSGQTLLYAADGRLLFSGGITISRGHAGDSVGRQAVLSLVNDAKLLLREAPVFGCHLVLPASAERS